MKIFGRDQGVTLRFVELQQHVRHFGAIAHERRDVDHVALGKLALQDREPAEGFLVVALGHLD